MSKKIKLMLTVQKITKNKVKEILKKHTRSKNSHKGIFGHSLIISGSYGMIGATQLCVKGCLRSGVGKVTTYVPECGYIPIQTEIPECLVKTDPLENYIGKLPGGIHNNTYQSIGIGCGLGTNRKTLGVFFQFLRSRTPPTVIDADALNLLSTDDVMLRFLGKNTVLTPHPLEFLRLIHKENDEQLKQELTNNEDKLNNLLKEYSQVHSTIIIYKTHQTKVVLGNGTIYQNKISSSALSKGGTGDILTGLITGLLAQGFSIEDACIVGVYIHSKAGQVAAKKYSSRSALPTDILNCIGEAFLKTNK